ncbi:dynein regulatory complex subunit 5-like [Onthophagus taurus]|uniref:dynein regulatory complex subunit 5-like n=1 Tax=Onthophagus taurus TaxID=166361 RepID=UPI0039BE700D
MRYPHIITNNVKIAYEPHSAAEELAREAERTFFAENFDFDKELCPSLTTLCVEVIAKNFKERPLLQELPCADRLHLLELLPTDIPLELAVPIIEEEIYWKRRYADNYGVVKYVKHEYWTWKCLYLEHFLRVTLEEAQPQYSDETGMGDLLKLLNPFVHKVTVTQLQAWKPPLTSDEEDIPEVYPIDHIDFEPVLQKLENITEVDIIFGMKNLEMNFEWHAFELSVSDCAHIGRAVLYLKSLKNFRLHKTPIDDDHLRALLENLINHETIELLDFSNCSIGKTGALCLAKVMLTMKTLTHLIISNNNITATGGIGLGYALLQPQCCPLYHLDMRLNPLKHDGVMGLLRAMARQANLAELRIGATMFEDDTALRVSAVIKLNPYLRKLDISSNWIDEKHYEELVNALVVNRTLFWINVREMDIPTEITDKIKKLLYRNRNGLDDVEEDEVESEEIIEEEEVEDEILEQEEEEDEEK